MIIDHLVLDDFSKLAQAESEMMKKDEQISPLSPHLAPPRCRTLSEGKRGELCIYVRLQDANSCSPNRLISDSDGSESQLQHKSLNKGPSKLAVP